jgi:hypothetical protein
VSTCLDAIERARLIERVETCVTTGDPEYPGLAVEICDIEGRELFHIVLDTKGACQIRVLATQDDFRLPLDVLEPLLAWARSVVAPSGVPPE